MKTRGYNKKYNKKGWDEIPAFFTMFLDYYLEYKYPVLALIMIISFNGIPLGANFYVAISGVLASTNDRPFFPLFLFVWAIAILGDLSCYGIWNKFGCRIMDNRERYSRIRKGIRKAKVLLNKYGKFTVLLTKFPLSGLGPYMAITAGITQWNFRLFAFLIIIGDFIWTSVYLSIGYFFAESWEEIIALISSLGQGGAIILLLIVLFLYIKRKRKK